MNIYKYHEKASELKGYSGRKFIVPDVAYEHAIITGRRFPEGEKVIASSPTYAYFYARDVIKGRFPEGEKAIATSSHFVYYYAHDVIKGSFPEGEKAIATSSCWAYYYAYDVIKGRFPEGEKVINSDPLYKTKYENFLNSL